MPDAYRINGLIIHSEFPFSALESLTPEDHQSADIALYLSDQLATLDDWQPLYVVPMAVDSNEPFLTTAQRDSRILLRAHGHVDFVMEPDGQTVHCTPLSSATAIIEQLFVDLVLPHLLQLRGRPCFHASAVALPKGDAVAFLGNSGAGKSTMAAAMVRRAEARLICDDFLALQTGEQGTTAQPSNASVRLWTDSAAALSGDADQLPRATSRSSKRRLALNGAEGPCTLKRFYLLEKGEQAPTIEPLSPRDGLVGLAKHLNRLDPDDRQALQNELALLSDLVARVPVYRLVYRRRYQELDRVVDAIVDNLSR